MSRFETSLIVLMEASQKREGTLIERLSVVVVRLQSRPNSVRVLPPNLDRKAKRECALA